ncbi:hypothetical protein HK098_003604 [Nowakowskiella sp. JEL0407]|nr:hypothetical protein HK098_003604 [Nowakowskiella sp. JEL0407]
MNLYKATKFQLALTSYVKKEKYSVEYAPSQCTYRLRFADDHCAERILIPYLLIPLKRILEGDLVMVTEHSENDSTIGNTIICGSEYLETIRDVPLRFIQRSCYAQYTGIPSVTTRNVTYNCTDKNSPEVNLRPYKLVATRIDEEGDADGDEWTFDVPNQLPNEYPGSEVSTSQKSKKTIETLAQLNGQVPVPSISFTEVHDKLQIRMGSAILCLRLRGLRVGETVFVDESNIAVFAAKDFADGACWS